MTRGQQFPTARDDLVAIKRFDPPSFHIRQPLRNGGFQRRRASLLLSKPPQGVGGHINIVVPDHIHAKFAKLDPAKKFWRIAQGSIEAKRIDESRDVNLALIAIPPANMQGERLRISRHRSDFGQAAHPVPPQ